MIYRTLVQHMNDLKSFAQYDEELSKFCHEGRYVVVGSSVLKEEFTYVRVTLLEKIRGRES